MKDRQSGFSGVLVLAVVVVLVVVSLTAWKVTKNDSQQPSETIQNMSESTNDCGNNRECFYQAYSGDCLQKTIKVTEDTIEGDPIFTTAKLSADVQGCLVEITIDSSQDSYGDPKLKIEKYTCEKLMLEDQTLIANECIGYPEATRIPI